MEQTKKIKTKISDRAYNSVAENYTEKFYIKDKIAKNYFCDNYKLNYQYYIISICKNGGLIAICKTKDYFDLKDNPLKRFLIVMHQDGKKEIRIPNSDLFKNRYVVSLEFNDKEQLYAFCNDGEIYKIDILNRKAQRLNFYSEKLKNEQILRVKAFEKGFIILTGAGTIFYLKDIKSKEVSLEFMVSLRDNLKLNYNDCEFFIIPASESENGSDEELMVCERNREGIYIIKKIKSSGSQFTTESKSQKYEDRKVNAIYINSQNVEQFDTNKKESECEDLETNINIEKRFGPVSDIAISNSNKKIAVYVAKKKAVYVFPSKIPSKGIIKYQKYDFKIEHDEYDAPEDIKEKNSILDFKNKQLLFMTDDCVAICGGRWVIMVNNKGKTFVEDLNLSPKPDGKGTGPYIHCKGISEVDGIRLLTKSEVILIRKIPDDIKPVYNIFAEHPTKQLLSSYEKFLAKDPFSNDELRALKDKLPEAITTLTKASGFLYYTDNEQETTDNKELQSYLLKAANYGKSIFGKLEFNFRSFNNFCRDLRIINAIRNFPEKARFLTLEEYNSLQSNLEDDILKKTMRQLNFKLAFQIAKFLGSPERDVYLKFAIKKIKKVDIQSQSEADEAFEEIMTMLKKLENISYIDIAKKCFKYHKKSLGNKFMEIEKSSLIKIPQYLELKEWTKSIELAIESNDINAVNVVLDNIFKVEEKASGTNEEGVNEVFVKTLADYPNIKMPVINYLKKNNKLKDLERYLAEIKDTEELFYFTVEKFFKSESKKEREEILQKLKGIRFEKADKKFYETYISDLESSLKFKKECIEKNIYSKDETTNFDNSIFECFERAISKDPDLVIKQNNKYFKLSTRKITILRFKQLFKNGKSAEIEKIIEEEGIKKLDISYIKIATMFLENNQKDKAIFYAEKETKENLNEEKANLLIKLEKYEDAAEVAIKIKDQDKCDEIFNILAKKLSNDKARRDSLQEIYNKRK